MLTPLHRDNIVKMETERVYMEDQMIQQQEESEERRNHFEGECLRIEREAKLLRSELANEQQRKAAIQLEFEEEFEVNRQLTYENDDLKLRCDRSAEEVSLLQQRLTKAKAKGFKDSELLLEEKDAEIVRKKEQNKRLKEEVREVSLKQQEAMAEIRAIRGDSIRISDTCDALNNENSKLLTNVDQLQQEM